MNSFLKTIADKIFLSCFLWIYSSVCIKTNVSALFRLRSTQSTAVYKEALFLGGCLLKWDKPGVSVVPNRFGTVPQHISVSARVCLQSIDTAIFEFYHKLTDTVILSDCFESSAGNMERDHFSQKI